LALESAAASGLGTEKEREGRTLLKMLQKALLTLLCAAAATLGEWAVCEVQERLYRRRKAKAKKRKPPRP
jgi:hypothetical protein